MTGSVQRSAADAVAESLARIDAAPPGLDGIWITVRDRQSALTSASAVDARVARGEALPLAGLTLAVKDNIDVAGLPTTAACPAFAYTPPTSAAVVDALTAAGAVVIGKTNLDQFATGLVGTRSPYGICPNPRWPGLVSGGSSSGSAAAIAAGFVDIALGTDTAGSGRVPAAANALIGLKPTRGRFSAHGVVPACRSLDCVSVFASSLDVAALVASIAAGSAPDERDPWSRRPGSSMRVDVAPRRIGVLAPEFVHTDGDESLAARYTQFVSDMSAAGYEIIEIDFAPFLESSLMLYGTTFVAERYEAVGEFVTAHPDEVDPVVGPIIAASADLPAWRVFADRTRLEGLRKRADTVWNSIDALAVPTVPRIPTVAEVIAAPIERNSMLGRYTNFVNLFDLCALALPVEPYVPGMDAPPYSVTYIAPAWRDDTLVRLGRETLASLRTV
ncbi:MAG: allophanate hydrolase [Acidimicrobiia bacterium]